MPPFVLRLVLATCLLPTMAQTANTAWQDKFRQLDEVLPTPNEQRTASGAPAHAYWQQRADYVIDVTLDEKNKRITGSELITYHNNSPDTLRYLWVQLDQNRYAKNSRGLLAQTAPDFNKLPYSTLTALLTLEKHQGGYHITAVRDGAGQPLPHTINGTMMRVDLPQPLKPGTSTQLSINWWYNELDATKVRARGGYECFEKDSNCIFEISRWYPRMAAYMDVTGWQNKPFLGSGEFTLDMGDFVVNITVPEDHVVAATGVLQNPEEVLNSKQKQRLQKAKTASKPVYVITPKEARRNEKSRPKGTRTWLFKADNVRDFAWASSRKFIWDAQGYPQGDDTVMAMSFYPNEAEPLWSRYSTPAIIHTMNVYSKYTFDYPWPVAQSVNGPVGGMEYPMISFNAPRPEEDGTYYGTAGEKKPWKHSKYGLISVIIHEVGHNYFPMIVNSDERQWTWMDEGLNTFLQFLAEQEWEEDYPSRRGEPRDIVDYMVSDNQVPIMTNSESLLQFGNNAYAKPATALNILRETILGRELFDYAFREYARRWKFKHPMPADFFRTMEDASAVDLDWFWRGWFYSTDHVDIGISGVHLYQMDTGNPEVDKANRKKDKAEEPVSLTKQRNKGMPRLVDSHPELKDFYNEFDEEFDLTPQDIEDYKDKLEALKPDERLLLKTRRNFYVVDFENHGGLVMPIILKITYDDGRDEILRIPAEIWRKNPKRVSKLLMTPENRHITALEVDPFLETADTNLNNNRWPAKPIKSRFQLWKEKNQKNAMQQQREAKK